MSQHSQVFNSSVFFLVDVYDQTWFGNTTLYIERVTYRTTGTKLTVAADNGQ